MKPSNDKSYLKEADKLFMAQFWDYPCAICGKQGYGHHIVKKSQSKALRYDFRNIIVLCIEHHTASNYLAPHSTNQEAVERFNVWFKVNKPEQYKWLEENKHIVRKYSYKQALANLQAGKLAWEN